MSRIVLIASLAMATNRGTAPHANRPIPRREPQFVAETFPATPANPTRTRAILWRQLPGDESPFGLIPTEWTAQTELLPGTWDGNTVFASSERVRIQ